MSKRQVEKTDTVCVMFCNAVIKAVSAVALMGRLVSSRYLLGPFLALLSLDTFLIISSDNMFWTTQLGRPDKHGAQTSRCLTCSGLPSQRSTMGWLALSDERAVSLWNSLWLDQVPASRGRLRYVSIPLTCTGVGHFSSPMSMTKGHFGRTTCLVILLYSPISEKW